MGPGRGDGRASGQLLLMSDKHFLVSCQPTPDSRWGIYLADAFDNLVLIREEGGSALFEPVPLRKTPRPPVIPGRVTPGSREVGICGTTERQLGLVQMRCSEVLGASRLCFTPLARRHGPPRHPALPPPRARQLDPLQQQHQLRRLHLHRPARTRRPFPKYS